MKFTVQENVIIKKPLPVAGIVCSNPQRTQRLLDHYFPDAQLHTNSWGIVIYTGSYQGHSLFVANVPMGAGGSGFAFLEMYAAKAHYIVRYGSNDRYVTPDNLKDINIIDEANNLYGLMRDSGLSQKQWGQSLFASPLLIDSLRHHAESLHYPVELMICHHIEDYHAYNYPELIGQGANNVTSLIDTLESNTQKKSAWDMETAALFWRATQFQQHAASVLQSLIKHRGETTAYEGEYGRRAKEMEQVFGQLILDSLVAIIK